MPGDGCTTWPLINRCRSNSASRAVYICQTTQHLLALAPVVNGSPRVGYLNLASLHRPLSALQDYPTLSCLFSAPGTRGERGLDNDCLAVWTLPISFSLVCYVRTHVCSDSLAWLGSFVVFDGPSKTQFCMPAEFENSHKHRSRQQASPLSISYSVLYAPPPPPLSLDYD